MSSQFEKQARTSAGGAKGVNFSDADLKLVQALLGGAVYKLNAVHP
jgi:hypothetical protein